MMSKEEKIAWFFGAVLLAITLTFELLIFV